MSTRGIIARKTPGGWLGRYHSDSYPNGLGKTLFTLANGHFKGKLAKMMRVLTVEHTGWSSIVGADFNWTPGYVEPGTVQKEVMEAFSANSPKCYCHGQRVDKGWIVRPEDEPQEWAYVVNAKKGTMDVLYGNGQKKWVFVKTVAFDGPEPDWSIIECGEKLERCSHYKYIHDKTVCPGCDGKKHQASSGHSGGYKDSYAGQDHSGCVPVAKLPEPLKTYYLADKSNSKRNDWHCYNPKICKLCGGNGIQTPEQKALRHLISKELRRQYRAQQAAEQAAPELVEQSA